LRYFCLPTPTAILTALPGNIHSNESTAFLSSINKDKNSVIPANQPDPPSLAAVSIAIHATIPINRQLTAIQIQSAMPTTTSKKKKCQSGTASARAKGTAKFMGDYKVGDVVELRTTDVLLGRGNGVVQFEGNINFRRIVWKYKALYGTLSKPKKAAVARRVMRDVAEQPLPGRFVEYVGRDTYAIVDDAIAFAKTCQSLRERKVGCPPKNPSVSQSPSGIVRGAGSFNGGDGGGVRGVEAPRQISPYSQVNVLGNGLAEIIPPGSGSDGGAAWDGSARDGSTKKKKKKASKSTSGADEPSSGSKKPKKKKSEAAGADKMTKKKKPKSSSSEAASLGSGGVPRFLSASATLSSLKKRSAAAVAADFSNGVDDHDDRAEPKAAKKPKLAADSGGGDFHYWDTAGDKDVVTTLSSAPHNGERRMCSAASTPDVDATTAGSSSASSAAGDQDDSDMWLVISPSSPSALFFKQNPELTTMADLKEKAMIETATYCLIHLASQS